MKVFPFFYVGISFNYLCNMLTRLDLPVYTCGYINFFSIRIYTVLSYILESVFLYLTCIFYNAFEKYYAGLTMLFLFIRDIHPLQFL